jgi:hypothetical protein
VSERRGGRGRWNGNTLSLALFGLAALLLIVVAVLYVRDRHTTPGTQVPPTARPGQAELKNVVDALRTQGINVGYSQNGARIPFLSPPGQALTADGSPLYVFIFEDPADLGNQMTDFDPTNPGLVNMRGTPVTGGPPHVVTGSNILAVLIGGSADLAARVDRAIKGLP